MKINITIILIVFCFATTTFGSNANYPFTVKISGQGDQSIIFIPGFASSGDVWKDTLTQFEGSFTCYTFTMAGFAGVAPQQPITFENWKSEIANYIKNEKIEQPILIGHSMGGGLALAIAADYPELIKKIVIVDALPALMALSNPDFKPTENLDCSEQVKRFQEMEDLQFYQMQKSSLPMMMENSEMHDAVLGWSVASDRETFAKMYCDFTNTDLRPYLKKIESPALILLQSYFVNFKPAIEAQYKDLKTGKLRYANKGLHFIMYDDKDWYFNELKQFITVN
ncbi:alpha/beta hydrolase [uncultured Gelidibacter sp.]|uniref:alpha/beta fold hydrolase n=1 Tax=uncultured Gelidibacter sp. TaxID=259318 RepID=UPI0026251E58|nr:alpha/beta hydrolase [uncultured Gelidibacter sp.]